MVCVPFLRIMCISYCFWPIHITNLQAINAVGRSDIFLKLELVKKGLSLAALLVGIQFNVFIMVCIKAFQEAGYRVPEDISVASFDDLPFCEISSPRLTTIKVFKYEMGQIAVRRLIEVMKDGGKINTKTQVCTEFVERDSVIDLNSASKAGGN